MITKLNESYTTIESENIKDIYNFLKCERPGAYFEPAVQAGFKSPYEFFSKVNDNKLTIMNGHLGLLKHFGIQEHKEEQEFTSEYINNRFKEIFDILPFSPYDYQIKCAIECILFKKQMSIACTGSGKSLIIFMIIYFMYLEKKTGYIIVPNINLLTQLYADFGDYIKDEKLKEEFLSAIETQGAGNQSSFNSFLTISTWQSLANKRNVLDRTDFIICDELHRYAADVSSSIVKESTNAKYRLGFTGTIPEDPVQKMMLIGMFNLPKVYIRSKELIERGLATPIKINSLIFEYNNDDKNIFRNLKDYAKQLKFIKEHELRQKFVVNLACKLQGNTLILGSHSEHIKSIFTDIMKIKYPDALVQNKDITGKKSFEFQEQYEIYFINGEDDAKTREQTRLILESHDNAIIVSNYSILSTGVNIKKLHNMIFASPLKAFTTITQSIGRGLRLHESKSVFTVYDLVDNFGIRKPGGIFWKQYQHRLKTSYNPEEFPISERHINIW